MYAKGKKALGICDRCGFTYKLAELKYEVEDKVRNGLRVCNSCFDPDHPQLRVGELKTSDLHGMSLKQWMYEHLRKQWGVA